MQAYACIVLVHSVAVHLSLHSPFLLKSMPSLTYISYLQQGNSSIITMDKSSISITLLIFFSFLASSTSHNVPSIFTFGDSIFDAGTNHFNKNCTLQADFPPYGHTFFHHPTGRFTNGRTVVDFISQFLHIDLQKPYLEVEMEIGNGTSQDYPSNGINFASAGSGVLNATNKDAGVLSIQDQLRQFQNLVKNRKIDRKIVQQSLFLFESGSNDAFNYFIPSSAPTVDPESYVKTMLSQVQQFIDQIYHLGARRVAIFSLGPVGCVPARVNLPQAPVNKCYGKMNKLVKMYNTGLQSLVNSLPIKYLGAVGAYGDVYGIVQHFRSDPQHYGFSNTSSACCGEGTLRGFAQCGKERFKVCQNPSQFLFWDYFHPSEHAYKLISKALWSGKSSEISPHNLKTLANMKFAHY